MAFFDAFPWFPYGPIVAGPDALLSTRLAAPAGGPCEYVAVQLVNVVTRFESFLVGSHDGLSAAARGVSLEHSPFGTPVPTADDTSAAAVAYGPADQSPLRVLVRTLPVLTRGDSYRPLDFTFGSPTSGVPVGVDVGLATLQAWNGSSEYSNLGFACRVQWNAVAFGGCVAVPDQLVSQQTATFGKDFAQPPGPKKDPPPPPGLLQSWQPVVRASPGPGGGASRTGGHDGDGSPH